VRDDVYLQRDRSIGWLVLNRADKRNALNLGMWTALPSLIEAVQRDASLKVLVVRGVDASAFSAGADISEFESVRAGGEAARTYNAASELAERALAALEKPTIAMIQGPCIGGGCGLAIACDFRLSDDSGRFGITPAKLGLVYSLQATKRLVDLVGPSRAKYILLTGRQMDAARALEIGLVDEVFPPADLVRETTGLAATLASLAQFSVRSMKRIIELIVAGQVADSEETTRLRNESFDSDDYREGVRAFLEKRAPSFT
jgi:enoyl-CoA hydratase/carnithine racemase